jgi:hypothetical protein
MRLEAQCAVSGPVWGNSGETVVVDAKMSSYEYCSTG